MRMAVKRLSYLKNLSRPLLVIILGAALLSLGVVSLFLPLIRSVTTPDFVHTLLLQFLPLWGRGLIFLLAGVVVLLFGIWRLSEVVVISLDVKPTSNDLVLGYERALTPPRITVISGGAGMLILASLGQRASSLICITPVQDPVEYYYRASSLLHFEQVVFVAPTPQPVQVEVTLDDGQRFNIKRNISHTDHLALRHVERIELVGAPTAVTGLTLESIRRADVIVLGPGSLFESVLPSLLLSDVSAAMRASKAQKIYICSLMTEPGLTTGFAVADHIRQFERFAGFVPDYVLVNAQRIDPDVRQIYAAANQSPVFLSPEEYEETIVSATDRETTHDLIVEGAIVIEADLASSVVQLTASLDTPGESRTVRVLRHDPDKLAAAITEILRRG
ncbi:MAG: 2-phospho-L-lactate transferase CofD family protein [Roseiflexaceae bacterium]|nr:2-phospho-L-lactate transferase CofD family protein [Roseiflexaceae bacterium]